MPATLFILQLMARWSSLFFSFSRSQRSGIVVLGCLLIALLLFRFSLSFRKRPDMPGIREQRFRQAWEHYRASMPRYMPQTQQEHRDAGAAKMLPEFIDLNCADSLTLVNMKGIGPVTAHKILEYRERKGAFRNVSEIRKLAAFSDSSFAIISRHLIICDSAGKQ